MKRIGILAIMMLFVACVSGQDMNSGERMLASPEKLTIGGYAQIDYNQPLSSGEINNGLMDVHRLVLLFGYKFSDRASFVTEIEMEHVKELYVEQAYLNYEILPWLSFRSGLMLIPMGIVNEYHEPPTFNGVERPNLDKYIVPTTWREIGAGFTGHFLQSGITYQLYLVNGFLGSDDGAAKLSGSSLFRSGRQKGASSVFSQPNLAFRVGYTGVPGLNTGLSGYFGQTQSTLLDGIDKAVPAEIAMADSSLTGIRMIGWDARYTFRGFGLRGQLIAGSVTNTEEYNQFHGSDVGSGFLGYYAELSYDLLHAIGSTDHALIPFFRYEKYNTHWKTAGGLTADPAYDRTDLTLGMGWKPVPGVICKLDHQWFMNNAGGTANRQINAGIGIWF